MQGSTAGPSSTATRPHSPCRAEGGFTLIEVMIVVAILGILAAVAYPSFMDQVRKGRRSDAVAALSAVQQAQERHRTNNTTYTANLTAAPTASPPGLGLSGTSEGGYYTISLSGNTATAYTVTATAVSGKSQASDMPSACRILTITVTNGSGVNGPSGCWSK